MDWFGTGEDIYLWSERRHSGRDPLKLWDEYLERIAKWQFNTIRLVFGCDTSYGTHPVIHNNLDLVDKIFTKIANKGIKIILNCMNGVFNSPQWWEAWDTIVKRFKNDPRIIAWELMNEPSNSPGKSEGITSMEDVANVLDQMTRHIRELGDTHYIIYQSSGWITSAGTWVEFPKNHPAIDPKLVMAKHMWNYGKQTTKEKMDSIALFRIQQILPYANIGFQLWNGEFGCHEESAGGSPDLELEKYYAMKVINLCLENRLGFNWWLYSENHWMPAGTADQVFETSNYRPTPKQNIIPLLFLIALLILGGDGHGAV